MGGRETCRGEEEKRQQPSSILCIAHRRRTTNVLFSFGEDVKGEGKWAPPQLWPPSFFPLAARREEGFLLPPPAPEGAPPPPPREGLAKAARSIFRTASAPAALRRRGEAEKGGGDLKRGKGGKHRSHSGGKRLLLWKQLVELMKSGAGSRRVRPPLQKSSFSLRYHRSSSER